MGTYYSETSHALTRTYLNTALLLSARLSLAFLVTGSCALRKVFDACVVTVNTEGVIFTDWFSGVGSCVATSCVVYWWDRSII